MSSLSAMLSAYTFEPGDVIHVDSGNYQLIKSLTLTAGHSGIRIEGPATGTATLDRNNSSFNVIDLQNADDLTIDRLSIRGGYYGIYAYSGSDSDRLTISNSVLSNNVNVGAYVENTNDFTTFQNNTVIQVPQPNGAWLFGNDTLVSGNSFSGNSGTAIEVRGLRSQVRNNTFTNVRRGINVTLANAAQADRQIARDNIITGSSEYGIVGGNSTLIANNIVSATVTGISANGDIIANTTFDNRTGIEAGGSGNTENNITYHNSNVGLSLFASALARNNRIYGNDIGVLTDFGWAATVSNNFVYGNATAGFYVNGSGYYGATPTISNNTVVQPFGDAIRVFSSFTQNVLVENNLLQVGSGNVFNVAADANRGFRSDYNLINVTAGGNVAIGKDKPYPRVAIGSMKPEWTSIVNIRIHNSSTLMAPTMCLDTVVAAACKRRIIRPMTSAAFLLVAARNDV